VPLRKKPLPQRLPPPRAPDSQESRIGRLLKVELNHDEFIVDADLVGNADPVIAADQLGGERELL